jgi:hypothetical protein
VEKSVAKISAEQSAAGQNKDASNSIAESSHAS